MRRLIFTILIIGIASFILIPQVAFIVDETETVIITRFGNQKYEIWNMKLHNYIYETWNYEIRYGAPYGPINVSRPYWHRCLYIYFAIYNIYILHNLKLG